MTSKANTLLVGVGGIGAISALNLETGGKAEVTAVLRSNYDAVVEKGFSIKSVDHGVVEGFTPTHIVKAVPDVEKEKLEPFKYIVCATKNIPDVPPSLVDIIKPSVTAGYTVIVLIQNGLNIEKPFLKAFPQNIVLSGVSRCGSHQMRPGEIVQDDYDKLLVAPFRNSTLKPADEDREAKDFCDVYAAGGKCEATFDADVSFGRWRKLVYNACLNPISAALDMDTGRLRLADDAVETLVRPAMEEIRAAATACGINLPEDVAQSMIDADPIRVYCIPSMQMDIKEGRFSEFENLVGEPLREGTARGVPMPTVRVFYNILKALQWRTRERMGMVKVPPSESLSH